MTFPTFWDFLMEGGYGLLFNDEETNAKQFICPNCGKKLTQTDKIECIDEVEKIFKCPFCDESIELK